MKRHTFVMVIVLVVCLTILAIVLLTRPSLCEIRIRHGHHEVAARLAYEPRK
ncbi:Hok/Gef family protein [Siccibacter turicensis]|uniref:Hok/Gef family protein n=1 Tax=Siccibacter turicensis TaxID=357233 RepID=A0A2P8VMY4_9ENTR|nr:Hok/Gef family protein [Siccibacter turicensis]MDY0969697.1 Hok/Gef family protein [Siccibacter turicensis]PSN08925.1 Hok/Gef family protein [Siccibacter turicensis]